MACPWNITSRREERLVMLHAGVVDPRHVLGGQDPDHTRYVVRGLHLE